MYPALVYMIMVHISCKTPNGNSSYLSMQSQNSKLAHG